MKKESENNIEESDDEMFRYQLSYYLVEQLHEMLGNQLSERLLIDNVKKPGDEICQFIELIETENMSMLYCRFSSNLKSRSIRRSRS